MIFAVDRRQKQVPFVAVKAPLTNMSGKGCRTGLTMAQRLCRGLIGPNFRAIAYRAPVANLRKLSGAQCNGTN
jgi:hypothetical protein